MKLIQDSGRFILITAYEERAVPKAARFRWNPDHRVWWTSDIENVLAVVNSYELEIDPSAADAIAAATTQAEAAIESSSATDADIDIPSPDGREFMPFQRAGIAALASRPNSILGDEMGLGKTVQAIGLINLLPDEINSVLVVCPASLKLTWDREITAWSSRPLTHGVVNFKKLSAKASKALAERRDPNNHELITHAMSTGAEVTEVRDVPDIRIINYEQLKKLPLDSVDLLVVDEAHYCKNPKSQRSQVVAEWAGRARRVILLTGTPLPNRPKELHPLLSMVDPESWPWWEFARRYCGAFKDSFGWNFDGAAHMDELQRKLRSTVMVRRLKADVLTELPPKTRQLILLSRDDYSSPLKAELAAASEFEDQSEELARVRDLAEAAGDQSAYEDAVQQLSDLTQVAFTEMAKLRHNTAVAKIPAVVDHVSELLSSTNKVVVMGHHHDVIDGLVDGLTEYGVVSLTGRDNPDARQAAVDAFQNDPNVRVFVGSIQAAGVGLTLTASSTVVFAELDWVPANLSQAEDRCHRITQTANVLVHHVVIDGSLDARMATRLVEKQAIIDAALDDEMPETAKISQSLIETPRRSSITPLPDDQIPAVHQALRHIAGLDDGARALDGQGFSRVDTDFGNTLAELPTLTGRQATVALRLVRKYQRQLPDHLSL